MFKRLSFIIGYLFAGSILFAEPAPDKLKLPALISDHMVIQRDMPFRVWGWAKPGDSVTVSIGANTASATADKDGKWLVKLKPIAASSSPVEMNIKGSSGNATIKDVLVGEVWLCSGQSNMGVALSETIDFKNEEKNANIPGMRLFVVKNNPSDKPREDCEGQWVLCNAESAKRFSGVGYYFGKDIAEAEKMPVGLIGSYQGASSAHPWVSLEALKANADLKKTYLDQHAAIFSDLEGAKAKHDEWLKNCGEKYEAEVKKWYSDAYTAKQKKEPFTSPRPTPAQPEPTYFTQITSFPTALYNIRIHPLINYNIKGALWYQGESNGPLYDKLMETLIQDWRTRWGIGDFTFLIVQLPNKDKQQADTAAASLGWASIRENQWLIQKTVPNTGLVCAIDVGCTEDPDPGKTLHPAEKANIGHRAALAARHYAYGEKIAFTGPVFESCKVEGAKMRITFSQTEKGLKIGTPPKNSMTPQPDTSELHGFIIAGEDMKFVNAKATIDGANSVLVWSDQVKAPKFVRYAWCMSPIANLYNSADLPTIPFRTDTEPGK